MAKGKKNKAKKVAMLPLTALKPANLIMKRGRSFPIYECRMPSGWFEGGKKNVLVARRMPNGHLVVGFYLIDLWCLGLKDTFYRTDLTLAEYDEIVGSMDYDIPVEKIEPALAFNMIYAAIEYAEDLGFEPAKDFKTTQYLLPEPDDFEYIEIETGLNGKPCYYPGPDDRVEAILSKLDKKVGKGNYTFDSFGDPRKVFGDYNLRSEIKEKYFPEDMVQRKMDTLDEEDKTMFMLQMVAIIRALEMVDGDLEMLYDEVYDDDFKEDLFEDYLDALDEMREMDGLPPIDMSEEMEETTRGFLNMTMHRVLRHDSLDFLFEQKYKPTLAQPTREEIMNMSPTDIEELMLDSFNSMSPEEQIFRSVRLIAFDIIEKEYGYEDGSHISEDEHEAFFAKVWEKVKEADEDDFWDETDEEIVANFRENVMEVIQNFNAA